jgi:hypothetical protein
LHVCREIEFESAVAIEGKVALGAVQYFSEYRHLASIERRPSAQDCWSYHRRGWSRRALHLHRGHGQKYGSVLLRNIDADAGEVDVAAYPWIARKHFGRSAVAGETEEGASLRREIGTNNTTHRNA